MLEVHEKKVGNSGSRFVWGEVISMLRRREEETKAKEEKTEDIVVRVVDARSDVPGKGRKHRD